MPSSVITRDRTIKIFGAAGSAVSVPSTSESDYTYRTSVVTFDFCSRATRDLYIFKRSRRQESFLPTGRG